MSIYDVTSTQKAIVAFGVKGDKGDPGLNAIYEHVQSSASSTWTVNHNLGFRPNVSVKTVGGVEVFVEVLHASINQVIIYFDTPIAGIANFS
jgi:hypothetical protein